MLNGMPIIVEATGPSGLPSTQAEVDERRATRLAKAAKHATVAEGSDAEKVWSGIERKLIKIVQPSSSEWPNPPPGVHVVLPGTKGHNAYIFQIRDRLKAIGFQWNTENKLWYRDGLKDAPPEGWC